MPALVSFLDVDLDLICAAVFGAGYLFDICGNLSMAGCSCPGSAVRNLWSFLGSEPQMQKACASTSARRHTKLLRLFVPNSVIFPQIALAI